MTIHWGVRNEEIASDRIQGLSISDGILHAADRLTGHAIFA